MINTLYSLDLLDSSGSFVIAFIIGILFGAALEGAGFGSSRRLSGVFYFRDMAVVKVMFTAVIIAMLGLLYAEGLGIINLENMYLMPTLYGAHIIGGLLIGVGFVMSGWCPGTAAVGMVSGSIDAAVCIIGILCGSILFNETFSFIKPLAACGNRGVVFLYDTLHMSKAWLVFLFTVIGIVVFWVVEIIEKQVTGRSAYLGSVFLPFFSVVLCITALLGWHVADAKTGSFPYMFCARQADPAVSEQALLQTIEQSEDHIEPEELADRLMRADQQVVVVDIRPDHEYARFHIRGALNISLSEISRALIPYKSAGMIVLYSNGMTHPAQARDSLYRQGFHNVYILTDGLDGFIDGCLKPVSLRSEPVPAGAARKIHQWRLYFLNK